MKLTQQKASISGLLLAVSFLALMSLAPLSAVLGTTAYSHSSWTWNPSYTHSHRSGSWTWSGTWSRSGSWTRTWSWSRTWSGTWSRSWTWSRTWTWRTHSYPTYTSTEYIFLPMPCDPNNPYSPCYSPAAPCNPYDPLSPCYVQPTTIISYSPPTQTIVVTESPIQTALVTQTFPPTIQPPDFALSVYPSTVSLPPGVFVGSTDFTLNLTSIQGWRGGIDFTTSSLPPGITFSNLPSQFSLSSPIASWDVQVNIGASAQAGSYAILIVASSGTLAYSTWLTVEVT
jgi:hypothetical protein